MKRKLIADAGSTKVDWAVVSAEGNVEKIFSTEGINALLADNESVKFTVDHVVKELDGLEPVDEIDYYGAGCATEETCDRMRSFLSDVSGAGEINVSTDLLGAARSLFGDRKGIACILGTGSNSCLYDGERIAYNVPSLGYILGDEGSGAALGKRLVSDAFKGQLPDAVREKFLDSYQLNLTDILAKVYKSKTPNRFLASFVPFLAENLWNPYVYSLVLKELTRFVKKNVAMYPGAHSLPLGFTGSVAFCFDRILREAASSQGYRVCSIVKSPMDGLIAYHASR